jgi:hypothetical protein
MRRRTGDLLKLVAVVAFDAQPEIIAIPASIP